MREEAGKAFFLAEKKQKTLGRLSRAALAAATLCTAARATTVQVTVQGVRNDQGAILVALCTRAEFLHPNCALRGHTKAALGEVTITIPNVPPGTYAAQAFHDENSNNRLDRNILGLPQEAMGFSNNAPMHLGPPSFDAASFPVNGEKTRTTFRLHGY